jgi:hypothetical protein
MSLREVGKRGVPSRITLTNLKLSQNTLPKKRANPGSQKKVLPPSPHKSLSLSIREARLQYLMTVQFPLSLAGEGTLLTKEGLVVRVTPLHVVTQVRLSFECKPALHKTKWLHLKH